MTHPFRAAAGRPQGTRTPAPASTRDSITRTVAGLRSTFASGRTRPLAWRRRQLAALARLVREHERDFAAALAEDLGRGPVDTWLADLAPLFEGRTEIAGPLALRLQVSTDAADLDVFASLQVLDADGAIAGPPAARGWLRLSHRELDEQASTTGSPVLAHRWMSQVVAGERYAVDVEMWPTAFVVPGNGSLVLTIQGIDTADAQLARHNDPDDRASTSFANWTTLYSDEHAPSTLFLPVSR